MAQNIFVSNALIVVASKMTQAYGSVVSITTVRLSLAPTSALTDARGHNEKARNLTAWQRQVRAVVSLPNKPTGVSASNTCAGLTPTHPGQRTRQSWQVLLSLRPPGTSSHGADNERHIIREAGSGYRSSYRRLLYPRH